MTSPILPTTLINASSIAKRLGLKSLTLASETFQVTGSFKFRAAYTLASSVNNGHIIAASSGNFGQALACACAMLGKSSTIVMPETSARVKIDAVRGYGGDVELIDTARITREARVAELASANPDAYVASAYDDDYVIAGNATLAHELARVNSPTFDAIVAPIGGGGLTSGLITGLASAGCPIPVIGAEPLLANDAAESMRAGRIVTNDTESATIADGARTRSVGRRNWAILQPRLRGIVEVPESAIAQAVLELFTYANLKAEPTGALSLAAVITDPEKFKDKHICCVISGGNVDPDVYARLIQA
jgi:threonine dehydratase